MNDSPFSGREGRFVTSREIRKRLFDELESNVAMRVEDTERSGEFVVSGRGELHLAILIETMRREGYELAVSKPEVIFRQDKDGVQEPIERVFIEVLNEYLGPVSEMLGKRRGRLQDLRHGEDGTVYAEFLVPTRGILGFRQPYLNATRGTGTFNTLFEGHEPMAGPIEIATDSWVTVLGFKRGPDDFVVHGNADLWSFSGNSATGSVAVSPLDGLRPTLLHCT